MGRQGLPALGRALGVMQTSAMPLSALPLRALPTASVAPQRLLAAAADIRRGYSNEVTTGYPSDVTHVGNGGAGDVQKAWRNPTGEITYDESNHKRMPPGDPSRRAFTYFVLSGGRFVY